MRYTIQNEYLKVTVDSKGCEIVSAITAADNREHIWQADPAAWKRHAPVLFPLVGKYRDNSVTYNGRQYHMTQHGFARDMEFEPVKIEDDKLTMCLKADASTLEAYPFFFKLECTYRLDGSSIAASWRVSDTQDEAMYFSIGAHPAFVLDGHESLTGCRIGFAMDRYGVEAVNPDTKAEGISYRLLNAEGLLEDKEYKLDTEDGVMVTEGFFDRDAYIIENNQCHEVYLECDGERFGTVKFDAPVFGLWSPVGKNVPFICIEPWYGRADRADYSGTLEEREWGNRIAPGEVFERGYTIVF